MRRFFVGCIVVIFAMTFGLAIVVPVNAEESNESPVAFRIAPAPVGYPVLEAGTRYVNTGATGTVVSVESMGTKFTMYGGTIFGSFKQDLSDTASVSVSLAASLLAGNKYDLVTAQIPLGLQALYQPFYRPWGSLFLFGGFGGDVAMMSMTVTIPQVTPSFTVNDDTTVSTTVTTGTISAGSQLNVPTGPFILSVFGVYHYTSGSYDTTQTSSMSYDYPSYSGTIDGRSAIAFGCDVLYVPWNVALSSQVQNTEEYTLATVGLKWLVSRIGGR